MDFIHILLSVYIRLFQTALPLSGSGSGDSKRQNSQQWAMWLPIVGWVSVSVRYAPAAVWLIWRVTSIRRLGRTRWDVRHSRDKYSPHLRKKRHRGSDVPADEMHSFEQV
jgi:hypothetical protein